MKDDIDKKSPNALDLLNEEIVKEIWAKEDAKILKALEGIIKNKSS